MISFFAPASNDQSLYYLDQMFGYMNNVLPVDTGALTIMGAMFKTINTTALTIGSIVVIYTIVMGLLKTAQEGEFLGRQWSSFWVPFRTVLGVTALFPTTAGYSMLQIVLMWVIVQGIGAADTLWTTTLGYVATNGGPYYKPNATAAAALISNNVTLPPVMTALFEGLTCQATLARQDKDSYQDSSANPQPLYYCNGSTDNFCKQSPTDMLNILNSPGQPANMYYNYQMGPNGVCGTLTFPDPASYVDPKNSSKGVVCKDTSDSASVILCAGLKQQVASLQAIVNLMANFATQLTEFDNEYWKFNYGNQVIKLQPQGSKSPNTVTTSTTPYPTPQWITNYCQGVGIQPANCCSKATSTTCTAPSSSLYPPYTTVGGQPSNIDASTNANTKMYWPYGLGPIIGINTNEPQVLTTKYLNDIQAAVASASSSGAIANAGFGQAQSSGWLVAGTYYYQIASYSNSVQASVTPPLSVSSNNPGMSGSYSSYRVLWQTASDVMGAIASSTSSSVSSSAATAMPVASTASSALNGAAAGITNNFMNELSGGGISTNPLISAQAFGEDLLISAQATYPVLLIASAALMFYSSLNFMVFGSGFTNPITAAAVQFLVYILWGIYMLFAGWCFTFGGMLAIYLPLVPYIIFTFGAIGWFIAVIEAMVAAPFVALGILSPTGHDLLGRAEPAIMIILNTFLRPTLMVFGMMAGMILAPAVVTMINGGFNIVVGSIYGGSHAPGPVELILFISAYGTLIITSMNKCFALIYMIPERVLTWIGGQSISYGEGESLGQVKGSVEGAAGAIKSGAESTGKQSLASAKKSGEAAGGGGNPPPDPKGPNVYGQ
jgi:hypothetical protein